MTEPLTIAYQKWKTILEQKIHNPVTIVTR
jgi:hypothetical protein